MENISKDKDLHRKIIVFMLVNPNPDELGGNEGDEFFSYGGDDKKLVISDKGNKNKNDINSADLIGLLIHGYYKDCDDDGDGILNVYWLPIEINTIIVGYMIESIAQLREKRNELRLKRFLPSKTRRRNGKRLASYELPWRSVTN